MVEQETTPPVDETETDYIAAIEELKNSTVSKEEYQKLRDENKKLLQSLIRGDQITPETETTPDIKVLRAKLFSEDSDLSNLDYAATALELRQALIDAGEKDPFLPWGKNISPTVEDIDAAERVAAVLNDCIEYANGDSAVFTNELQRRMIDSNPRGGKK